MTLFTALCVRHFLMTARITKSQICIQRISDHPTWWCGIHGKMNNNTSLFSTQPELTKTSLSVPQSTQLCYWKELTVNCAIYSGYGNGKHDCKASFVFSFFLSTCPFSSGLASHLVWLIWALGQVHTGEMTLHTAGRQTAVPSFTPKDTVHTHTGTHTHQLSYDKLAFFSIWLQIHNIWFKSESADCFF